MASYINLETSEYPVHQGDIRLLYPEMGEEFICPLTFAEVFETEKPEINTYQRLIEIEPEQIDGTWQKCWVIQNFTDEEILMKDTQPIEEPGVVHVWNSETKKWVRSDPFGWVTLSDIEKAAEEAIAEEAARTQATTE